MINMAVQRNTLSVLIIGATGRTGVECIRHLAQQPNCPEIHAFCESVSNLDLNDWNLCTSVIEGSARHAIDIEDALLETKADWIILCVGSGDDLSPTNVRTFTAENVARVLQKPQFLNVRVIAVSIATSIGMVAKCRLRNIISDHKGQETAIKTLLGRATIVRSTLFRSSIPEVTVVTSSENSPGRLQRRSSSSASETESIGSSSSLTNNTGPSFISSLTKSPMLERYGFRKRISQTTNLKTFTSIATFDETRSASSNTTNRSDLAQWIAEHICLTPSRSQLFDQIYVADCDAARIINVTSVPLDV